MRNCEYIKVNERELFMVLFKEKWGGPMNYSLRRQDVLLGLSDSYLVVKDFLS